MQLTRFECGAACLAMLLSFFGRRTTVAECRDRCSIGQGGASALAIADAAKAFGLAVKALAVAPAHFPVVTLPAIVHWNGDHFVVVERWSPTEVRIVDPATGRRRVSAEEFAASFTGVVLQLTPGAEFDRSSTPVPNPWPAYVKRLLRARDVRGFLGQILAASLLVTLAGLVVPLLTLVLVDQVMGGRMDGLVTNLAFGAAAVGSTLLVTSYLRSILLVRLQNRMDAQIMPEFMGHLLALPFRFFGERSSGDLIMRLGNNASIRDLLTSQAVSVILDAALASAYAVILFALAPAFGLVTLVIAALHVLVLAVTTRRLHRLMQQDLAAQSDAQGFAVETINGIETLKGLGAEWTAHDRWLGMFKRHLVVSMSKQRVAALVESTTTTLRNVTPIVLLFAGTQYVLAGQLSLGMVLALLTVATTFLTPLGSLVSTAQQLQLVGAQLERIGDVMHTEPEQLGGDGHDRPFTGAITLDRVGFRYDGTGQWVLRDVSVRIERGQRVAVVGASGAGKSTLAKLLLGLYDVTEGEITYDGRPLGAYHRLVLRRRFGTVVQDPFLFNMSVRENITLGDPSMSTDAVLAAARVAEIHQDVAAMPAGFNTVVSEGGRTLSGGQRQRLALARAVAGRPSVLLLDEATSHLDAPTEEAVMANLRELACTRIVIAHRLSTIRDADQILVLDGGRLVEQGRHEELLALGGCYTRLVAAQLDSQVT